MPSGSKRAAAEQIVHRFSLMGSATSLIPIQLADLAALAVLQVTMLGKLAKVYGTDFQHQRARQIVSTLIATVVPASLTNFTGRAALSLGSLVGAGSAVLRFAPVIGIPAMAYFTFASVYDDRSFGRQPKRLALAASILERRPVLILACR